MRLTYSRFSRLVKMLVEYRTQESRNGLVEAAFIGWQMGAAPGKTFGQYLEDLHLTDKPGIEKPKQTKEELIRKAEIIRERLKMK